MTFFSTVLPGLRDFRAPFSAGVLWFASITLILFPHRGAITSSDRGGDLVAEISNFPTATLLAMAAFVSYILGLVGTIASQRLRAMYTAWIVNLNEKREGSLLARLLSPFDPTSDRANALLSQHVRMRITRLSDVIGRDSGIRQMVADDRELTAFRLSKDAPEQYQQYDRTLAEAEFRTATALPILILSLTAFIYLPAAWSVTVLVAAAIIFFVLESRAAAGYRSSSELLSTTVFLSYTSPPSLDILEARIKEDLVVKPKRNDNVDLAWLIEFLVQNNLRAYSHACVSKARHPSRNNAVIAAFGPGNDQVREQCRKLVRGEITISGVPIDPDERRNLQEWIESNVRNV